MIHLTGSTTPRPIHLPETIPAWTNVGQQLPTRIVTISRDTVDKHVVMDGQEEEEEVKKLDITS